ncbi:hypothetical protein LSUB1_G002078 [Lachnellula subtilissima]|uniref:Uncharacterized protein n=1 Tax=Lachnellula subtilissima TaxID=602034 RepID=A0A8H8UBV6_9HELO|nr:hypothetical protein LSUB1_G002078 [Lachnellula subtilissima]
MASSISFILLIFALIGIVLADSLTLSCHNDNCLRAVAGTRQNPGQVFTASSDCSSFLQTTTTPPATTVTVTTTTTRPPSSFLQHKREALKTIPAYASPCPGAADYSSACSCLGVTSAIITAPAPTITSTVTVTATATVSPTNSPCQGHTCSQVIESCNNNESCYCFIGTNSTSICGVNVACAGLPACALDSDCASGSVCALETCCLSDLGGVCLTSLCENPAMRLMQIAKIGRADTAAFTLE